jgi:hypothetical protein
MDEVGSITLKDQGEWGKTVINNPYYPSTITIDCTTYRVFPQGDGHWELVGPGCGNCKTREIECSVANGHVVCQDWTWEKEEL